MERVTIDVVSLRQHAYSSARVLGHGQRRHLVYGKTAGHSPTLINEFSRCAATYLIGFLPSALLTLGFPDFFSALNLALLRSHPATQLIFGPAAPQALLAKAIFVSTTLVIINFLLISLSVGFLLAMMWYLLPYLKVGIEGARDGSLWTILLLLRINISSLTTATYVLELVAALLSTAVWIQIGRRMSSGTSWMENLQNPALLQLRRRETRKNLLENFRRFASLWLIVFVLLLVASILESLSITRSW